MKQWIMVAFMLGACWNTVYGAGYGKFTFPSPEEQQEFFRTFREKTINVGAGPQETVDPAMTFDGEVKMDGYTRYRVSYNVDRDERVSAWLLVPDHEPGTKLPLVFCPHPTWREGKDSMINQWKTPAKDAAEKRLRDNRANALELVQHGFICFVPDRGGYGERAPLPDDPDKFKNMYAYQAELKKRYPGWHHTFGKVPWDLSRALDALLKLDYVDGANVGTIGHSLGGWDSLYFWGSDPRVKAAVVNSGGAHWVIKEAWMKQPWRLKFAAGEQPNFKPNTDASAQIYIMMGAPRPLLYMRAIKDIGTDYTSTPMENLRMIREYYASFGKNPWQINGKNQFAAFFHDEGHDFPIYARELAYRWLETQLKPQKNAQ